ncbi:RiPP maturation radical SAM C-methyltransferase [Nonomuraea fastidiosa]|uniref:RiPP maturation radical SAM C-methyltransferase n=1 Tax=Nonomuraea fastidiosa TaxID=46173 RepID=UPI00366F6104
MGVSSELSGDQRALLTRTFIDPSFRKALRDDASSAVRAAGIDPSSASGVSMLKEIESFFARGGGGRGLGDLATVSLDIAAAKPAADDGSPRVAFVVMPWAETRWASIGVSLLQSALAADGLAADVIYANLDFAEAVGNDTYNRIGTSSPKVALVGEWLFAERSDGADERFLTEVLLAEHADFADFATVYRLGEIKELTEPFLDALARHEIWGRYDIVGFTSTFQQNAASFGLAKRLKRLRPDLTIIMGGGNCEGPMGSAVLRNYPAIDYVFRGEAEWLISRFVRDLRAAGARPGWVESDTFWSDRVEPHPGGRAVIEAGTAPSMDDLPVPQYHDFYARLRTTRPGSTLPVETAVPLETSRGCWWGDKKHCTFCGLNGLTMAFRSKSAARAFDELRRLVHEYGKGGKRRTDVLVVDNILDYRYFNDLLPMIAQSDLKVTLHYEVKANLRLDQLMLLRDAGVYHLQPGIESMSNRLLEAMRKGTTRLRNLQTMKWCTELGIDVSWNYLHGFPGETDDDYADLPELFGLVTHLSPPEHVGPARADRFSPFYESGADFGIVELEHEIAYDHIYADLPRAERRDMAYFFRMRCDRPLASEGVLAALRAAADRWRRDHPESRLEASWMGDHLRVLDTRPARPHPEREFDLDPAASSVLIALDQLRSAKAIERALPVPVPAEEIAGALDRLLAAGLVVRDDDSYLGLPILHRRRMPGPKPAVRVPKQLPVLTGAA